MNTETAVKQRAEQVFKEKDLSINLFAKGCGVSQQTLSDQFRGRCKLSFVTISAILEYFPDLSAEWLLRGEGEMWKTTTPLPSADDEQMISGDKDAEIEKLREENERLSEFYSLQKEHAADLKERIEEYKDRIEEYKERIAELKKAQTTATELRVKSV